MLLFESFDVVLFSSILFAQFVSSLSNGDFALVIKSGMVGSLIFTPYFCLSLKIFVVVIFSVPVVNNNVLKSDDFD